jgi:hypothetical protein
MENFIQQTMPSPTFRVSRKSPLLPRASPGARGARFLLEPDTASWQTVAVMNAQEVLAAVATMPSEEWMKIQAGIAAMLASRFSGGETDEIRKALAEAEAQFARGEALSDTEVRRHFGLS